MASRIVRDYHLGGTERLSKNVWVGTFFASTDSWTERSWSYLQGLSISTGCLELVHLVSSLVDCPLYFVTAAVWCPVE